jgi:hypothetical protein
MVQAFPTKTLEAAASVHGGDQGNADRLVKTSLSNNFFLNAASVVNKM